MIRIKHLKKYQILAVPLQGLEYAGMTPLQTGKTSTPPQRKVRVLK